MGNEYTTASQTTEGALTRWNINHAYAYKRQGDGVESLLQYLSSSTSPYPMTPTDSLATVVDLVSIRASANANTVSIISITALPPLTMVPHHTRTKFPPPHHLNVIFLAPLFAFLGILLGVAAAWLWFKLQPLDPHAGRRRKDNLSTVHAPGPDEDVDGERVFSNHHRSIDDVPLFAVGTLSKSRVHGTRYSSMHIREPPTNDSAGIKPLTPFLMGTTQFDSFGNAGSNHDDPFPWTRLPPSSSSTYDVESAGAGASRRSIFDGILKRADGMQYAAVRKHGPSSRTHSRLNSGPSETPVSSLMNFVSSATPLVHKGRRNAVYVPWRSLQGEVQRPARAWFESLGGLVKTTGGASYADASTRTHEVAGDQGAGYVSVETETPRTPISKHRQFSTHRGKDVPPLSSPSYTRPSPSMPTSVWYPPQSPGSPSPLVRSSTGLLSAFTSTHDRRPAHREAQVFCP